MSKTLQKTALAASVKGTSCMLFMNRKSYQLDIVEVTHVKFTTI